MARFHAPTILDTWKPKRYLAQQLAELLDDADESVIPLLVKVRKSLELVCLYVIVSLLEISHWSCH